MLYALFALASGIALSCKQDKEVPPPPPVPVPALLPDSALSPPPDSSPASWPEPEGAVEDTLIDSANVVVTKEGVGPVKLGMTLGEVKNLFPLGKFEKEEDGDGAPWIVFTTETGHNLNLYIGDSVAADSGMWDQKIETIETFSRRYVTESGVRVGNLISDAEQKMGKIKEISMSEIESREYVEFEGQPGWLTFRINYTGIYPEGSRHTHEYQKDGKIYAIGISSY